MERCRGSGKTRNDGNGNGNGNGTGNGNGNGNGNRNSLITLACSAIVARTTIMPSKLQSLLNSATVLNK